MRTVIILVMTLDQLRPGDEARVVDIRAGRGLLQRLNHLGIHAGDPVHLAGHGAFHGPVLVRVHGMQVALGRGIARRVFVEPVAAPASAPWRRHRAARGGAR